MMMVKLLLVAELGCVGRVVLSLLPLASSAGLLPVAVIGVSCTSAKLAAVLAATGTFSLFGRLFPPHHSLEGDTDL